MTFAIRAELPPLAVAEAVRRTFPVADMRIEENQIKAALSAAGVDPMVALRYE